MFKKKLLKLMIILTLIFPNMALAYSDKVILGGDNIGIKVNTKNVMIVGFYKVNDKYIGEDAGLRVGDLIIKVDGNDVSSINEMINILNSVKDKEEISLTYLRNSKEYTVNLPLIKDDNNVYKTGLYVKDQINGIGTLTYVDPDSGIFGALGHEITEKNSFKKIEIKDGNIYKSEITGIKPSENGNPGSKEAKLINEIPYGIILDNTNKGIFGKINNNFDANTIIEVADDGEIKLGKATIRTVINGNEVNEYEIEIMEIDNSNTTKNILFKITDQELLEKTGGVVAGMSGSPIIQNNKIVGAVTHVVVNEPDKGYGIFIKTMLEEGDKNE